MDITTLAPEKISSSARAYVAKMHRDVIEQVAAAVARDHIVLVGMAQNPFVKKSRQLLERAGAKYTYLEYGSYLSQWKQRLAIKLWAHFPTFPMVFIEGTLEGGHAELVELEKAGRLKA